MTAPTLPWPLLERAAGDILRSGRVVALTGAGISVESGIPPFRGKGGLWETLDPMEYAHIDAFVRDPEKVWRVLIKDMKEVLDRAAPNAAHRALAWMEKKTLLQTVITQNVDGLHQLAGSTDVIEFHGNFAWQRCMRCNTRIATAALDLHRLPPCCSCGGILRPECIFFGELIPQKCLLRAEHLAARCDVMLVVGTSASVYPAASMPFIARQNGATVIEINPEQTVLSHTVSDYLIAGNAGLVLKALVKTIADRL